MTMPDERTRALMNARELLSDISNMRSAADVNAIRQRANAVLRPNTVADSPCRAAFELTSLERVPVGRHTARHGPSTKLLFS